MSSQSATLILIAVCFMSFGAKAKAAETDTAGDKSGSTVYVSQDRTEIHSGPSEDFYPTGFVKQGQPLEVFHRTDDGWLGVRPPEGSFSWVPAADAFLLPGGRVIEITSQQAVSWIGTSLGSAKQYRWQVQLKPSEQLALVGEKSIKDAEGSEKLWYQVKPPAGEFRWIRARAVSSTPVVTSTRTDNAVERTEGRTAGTGATKAKSLTGKKQSESEGQAASRADVVSASYDSQNLGGSVHEGVITLGESSDYYDDVTMDGEGGSEVVEGEIIFSDEFDSQYADGGVYYEGDGFEEEYVEGEIYEDGSYPTQVIHSQSSDPFADWSAMRLDDDGMHFTLLQRMFGRAVQRGPDPLAADPFDLSMSQGTVRPASPAAEAIMGPSYVGPAQVSSGGRLRERNRPWRDPRFLRNQRTGLDGMPTYAPSVSSLDQGNLSTSLVAIEPTPLSPSSLPRGIPTALVSNQNTNTTAFSGTVNPSEIDWFGIGNAASAEPIVATASAQDNLDLNQLQLTLSETVTQPMQLWSFQPIYERAKYYVQHGSSAIERGQARLLMERIEEFANLAAGSGYMALNRANAMPSTISSGQVIFAGATTSSSQPAGSINTASTTSNWNTTSPNLQTPQGNSIYDATGWLIPVMAAGPNQPSHALTDETGRILAYVSGVPGLNLERYLNQAVGISGLRGYLPQLQTGHIQAQRLVRLR